MPVLAGAPEPGVVRNIRAVGTPLSDITARLGGVDLGVVHHSGANVHLAGLEGWFAPVGTEVDVAQRTADDGVHVGPAYLGGRNISLLVHVDGGSWAHAGEVLEEIVGAIPVNSLGELVVTDSGGSRMAQVQQLGEPQTARNGHRASLSLGLLAPDPRRYDVLAEELWTGLPSTTGGILPPAQPPVLVQAVVASGVVRAENRGNSTTPPVITIYGPCAAWQVSHVGQQRRLYSSEPIPAGRRLVLDMESRTARLDGTALRVVSGSPFVLDPGVNEIAFNAATPNPESYMSVSFRSAWR